MKTKIKTCPIGECNPALYGGVMCLSCEHRASNPTPAQSRAYIKRISSDVAKTITAACPCGKTDAHSHRIAEAGGTTRALTHVEIIGRMQGSGGKPAALVMGACPVVSPMISDSIESTMTCSTNRDKIAGETRSGVTLFECAKHGGLYEHGKRCYRCEPMRDDVDPATGVKLSQDEHDRRYGIAKHDHNCPCAICQDNVRRPRCPICRDRHHPHCPAPVAEYTCMGCNMVLPYPPHYLRLCRPCCTEYMRGN